MQFIKLPIDKTITPNGAVGSLINTLKGVSLLIRPFDTWPCYVHDKVFIEDERLSSHIRRLNLGAENIRLFKLEKNEFDYNRPRNQGKTIKAKYFPEWFYCPECRRMGHIDQWRQEWRPENQNERAYDDDTPRCQFCKERSIRMNRRRRNFYLEQIRFVLINPQNGDLIDINWGELVGQDNENNEWLEFSTSRQTDDISGLYVSVRGDRNRKFNFGSLMRYEFADGYIPVLKNSSAIYHPILFTSIWVPSEITGIATRELVNHIVNFQEKNDRALYYIMGNLGIEEERANQILQDLRTVNFDYDRYLTLHQGNGSEADYRWYEFNYLTNVQNDNQNSDISHSEIIYPDPLPGYIDKVVNISRLKATTIVTGYTRGFAIEGNAGVHRCSDNPAPNFYPAVESYGEGILLKFKVQEIDIIMTNFDTNQDKRRLFVHVISHALMKRFEAECGYPLSSIRERLYLPEADSTHQEYAGVMIYCLNGSEGSYGGLSEYVAPQMCQLLDSAIMEGSQCIHDPICENENAHCYACLDIPEISCDGYSNRCLDRKILLYLSALRNR